jgi:hypothetical protein
MSPFTRLFRILASRTIALLLLVMLAAVAILGGLISQLGRAGIALPPLLARLSLNDLFQARWLLVIAAALVVNLLLCSLARMRLRLLQPAQVSGLLHFRQVVTSIPAAESATIVRQELLNRRFHLRQQVRPGKILIAGRRNRLSLTGSIFFHLAFIVAFVGFVVRSRQGVEGEFDLFPEQTQTLIAPWGDTLQVQLADFTASYSIGPGLENYILRQRRSTLMLYRNNRFVRPAVMEISRPVRFEGFGFFAADPLQVFVVRAQSRQGSGVRDQGSGVRDQGSGDKDTVLRVRENELFRLEGAGTLAIGTARLGRIYQRDSAIAKLPVQAALFRVAGLKESRIQGIEGSRRREKTLESRNPRIPESASEPPVLELVDTLRMEQILTVGTRPLSLLNIRQGLRIVYRYDPGLVWFYAAGVLFLLGILLRGFLPAYELYGSITDEEGETVVRLGGRALGLFTSLRPIVNGIADRFETG